MSKLIKLALTGLVIQLHTHILHTLCAVFICVLCNAAITEL